MTMEIDQVIGDRMLLLGNRLIHEMKKLYTNSSSTADRNDKRQVARKIYHLDFHPRLT